MLRPFYQVNRQRLSSGSDRHAQAVSGTGRQQQVLRSKRYLRRIESGLDFPRIRTNDSFAAEVTRINPRS
jgi:hypothetical protein